MSKAFSGLPLQLMLIRGSGFCYVRSMFCLIAVWMRQARYSIIGAVPVECDDARELRRVSVECGDVETHDPPPRSCRADSLQVESGL